MDFPVYEKKKTHWDFDRDFIEAVDCFEYYSHINNINSSNPWMQDVFLFICVFNLFQQHLYFSVHKSFTSLVKFIPKYFIIFDDIGKGIVFLISFLDYSLLICRNTIDFLYWFLSSSVNF